MLGAWASRLAGVVIVFAPAAGGPASTPDDWIAVPGSDAVVRVWDQIAADGMVDHFYTIEFGDGRSRVVETSYDLLLRFDEFDPLVRVPDVPAALALAPDDREELIYIVQFVTQPLEGYRRTIRDLGGTVYKYLGNHAHLVRMTAAASEQAEMLPFVRWVGLYQPAYRLEPFLVDNIEDAAQVYPRQRYNIMVFEPGFKGDVADRIGAIGGAVDRRDAGKYLVEATLTPGQLFQIAGWNEVLFVDRWTPWGVDMNIAREIGGANYVETVAGFTGQGVRGEVIDVGFNLGHVDFQSRPLIEHTPVSSDSHGASTSGIIFGDGEGDPMGRGLLPHGQGIVADTEYVFTGPARYLHTGELLQSPYFAVFQSASVGSQQVTAYTSISADTDAMLFDWDILHCQSQSNTGNQNSRPQAWAKNIVSVGGIRHMDTLTVDDDCWGCESSAASIGPAADGRIKPDLAHFYDNIFTVTSGSPNAYTSTFGGTSGATPIIAGHFGIFFQMWSEGIFGYPVDPNATVFENRPHMTMAKAMLINTADQWEFTGTNHDLTRVHQGWGRASVGNLYDLRDKMLLVDETVLLQNLDSVAYDVVVDPDEDALKATLVYADPPGVPGSNQHRINDLTLKVTDPGGQVYWGNNGLHSGNWSIPGGFPNTVDTVENVFVERPTAGTWTVEVFADEINEDSHVETAALDADFALVVSGVQPVLPAMLIRLPDGTPSLVAPGVPTNIPVTILSGGETVLPETAELLYRFDGGDSFASVAMTHDGGIHFTATLPAATCHSTPQFYFSAQGDGGTIVTNPIDAPSSFYEAEVGTLVTAFSDDFESDLGWTAENLGATTGDWQRGVPVNDPGWDYDPVSDSDGSGQCYLTQNEMGNTDVDDGAVRLTSPTFDMAGGGMIGYDYYLYLTNDDGSDRLLVEVNNTGGTGPWTEVTRHDTNGGLMWRHHEITEADLVAVLVPPTAEMRIRFTANDADTQSIVEAGIDGFSITQMECLDTCPADIDGDGEVGILDFLALLGAWGPNPGHPADIDGDGEVGILDFLSLLAAWGPCP
jgi:hypothetical protein